jgi:hypothetical protein
MVTLGEPIDLALDPSSAQGETVDLCLDELRRGRSPRREEINGEHVRLFVQLKGRWPPILVMRADLTVVDGLHRYYAARMLGHTHIACRLFDGGSNAAFVESVRCNIHQGLPLTMSERKDAAARILEIYSDWSDRRVAIACGLAPGTVSRIREQCGCSTVENDQLNRRKGSDGRSRPVDVFELRSQIARALANSSEASDREIARSVGAAPATVSSVRRQVTAEPAAGRLRASSKRAEGARCVASVRDDIEGNGHPDKHRSRTKKGDWTADSALIAMPHGDVFADWLDRTMIAEEWRPYLGHVPLSRIYELADEARRRAACWLAFADAMETRIRSTADETG